MPRYNSKGFTLIELMIVIAVIGIIAAIAIPSYSQYVVRSKRGDAMAALLSASQAVERFKSNNNFSYSGVNAPFARIPADSVAGKQNYDVAIANLSSTTYTITASPVNSMSGKDDVLSLDQDGNKKWGTKTCWPEAGSSC